MLQPDLLQRFTSHLKEALQKALGFAIRNGRELVEPGDLLVGLLQEKGSIGGEILLKSQVSLEAAESVFRGFPTPHAPGGTLAPDLSPTVKRILEKSVLTAHVFEHKYIGTEHVLMAVLETPLPDVESFLLSCNVSLEHAKEQVVQVLKSTSRFPDLALPENAEAALGEEHEREPSLQPDQRPRPSRDRRVKALEVFARDLTAPETISSLDPVIGRETETSRVIEILCRRFKNNPILLGEPGVGKTAIVEGLAQRLAADEVPDILRGKRLLAVDLALMVAGTMYRGEFEARLKQLIDEARQDKNVILFIDEIHTIVGAGSTSGSLDAANMLKPALARGEIRCIGATTWAEYKKHLEPDAALERRYQPVDIHEPSAELTLEMLRGLRQRYEDYHGIVFEPAALEAAVSLSERYLTERFFPDKAIDVLDEAAAVVNTRRPRNENLERLRSLDVALDAAREQKEEAVNAGDLVKASACKADEQRLLKEKKQLARSQQQKKGTRLPVTPEDIAHVVARQARISLAAILASDHAQLIALEERLAEVVMGQTSAVHSVAEAVRKARLGLSDPARPKASFLFVGPSGTGKTELARAMAREIFGRADALVKFDMSEFSEGHSMSKLLGSPAGYVGYRETNRLADTLRKRPHAVILFDEFEKAHPDVQHLLLQALEDGLMTDASGRAVPFRHAYVVLTSNVGANVWQRTRLGFDEKAAASHTVSTQLLKEQLKERFKPEFLNRLDAIVAFQPLEKDVLREIVKRELSLILERVQAMRHVAWHAGAEVIDWLLTQDWNAEEGARAARHIVAREVTPLISRSLLAQPQKRAWQIKVKKNALQVV